ncbi:MAG: hypothetical protein H7Z70_05250 [Bacteroidia bacterium]|nr:hypothetical protein [Methylotenera sp.]
MIKSLTPLQYWCGVGVLRRYFSTTGQLIGRFVSESSIPLAKPDLKIE